MSSNVRELVRDLLQPLITGNRWSVKPYSVKTPLTLSRPTVFIEHTGIDPLAEAPIGHLNNTALVTILDHHTDYSLAEDALDGKVLELIQKLDGHDRLNWTKATKTEAFETYLGWAITLTLITETEE